MTAASTAVRLGGSGSTLVLVSDLRAGNVAVLIVAHQWAGTVGRSHDDPGGIRWACTCGHESSIDGMSGHSSWRAAHALHAADELLAVLAPAPQPAAETERDERLRGIQESASDRRNTLHHGPCTSDPCGSRHCQTARDRNWLLAEVARLDAVVTAFRTLEDARQRRY